ncbi:MAG: sigma-70 family RNA polymerase sigma factor [Bacteroidota bacterium]
MKSEYSDEQLKTGILQGGKALEEGMRYLYEKSGYKEGILTWLAKKGASREAAQDVFQDGIRHLIINIRNGKFRAESSIKTYLHSICTNLWNNQYRRNKRYAEIKQEIPKEEDIETGPDELLEYQEKRALLDDLLSQIGKSCKKVLGLWSLSYSMSEIAQKAGYKSDGMARKKKYDCFKRLMKLLHDRPDLMDELLKNR